MNRDRAINCKYQAVRVSPLNDDDPRQFGETASSPLAAHRKALFPCRSPSARSGHG